MDLECQSISEMKQAFESENLRRILLKYCVPLKGTSRRQRVIVLPEVHAMYEEAARLRTEGGDVEDFVAKCNEAGDSGLHLCYVIAGEALALRLGFDLNYETYNGDLPLSAMKATIDRIIEYFKRAGEKNVPEGWEYLTSIHLAINDRFQDHDSLVAGFRACREAGRLGSSRAHSNFYALFRDQYPLFKRSYGAAPQYDLWKSLKSFIEDQPT
jgi:hypothetical protein